MSSTSASATAAQKAALERVGEFSPAQEICHSVSHGIGLIAVLVGGLPILLGAAAQVGDPHGIAGHAVFGASLVALYAASTVYHALPPSRAKECFRVLDHAAIYLLIAGTYTPFTLGILRGAWGWTMFALIWSLAALGIADKAWFGIRAPQRSTVLYLAMGWSIVIAARPLSQLMPAAGLLWLLAGGLCYTLGVAFYARDERWRHGHVAWHLFVLAGSACHFYAVLRYSGPAAG